ncbi:MAG: hypothetical protein AAB362_02110 [Patescibacteria group bacterium]
MKGGIKMLFYDGEKTTLQCGDLIFFDTRDSVVGFLRNGSVIKINKLGENAGDDDKLYCKGFSRENFSSITQCIAFLFLFETEQVWYSSSSRIGYKFIQTSVKHYDSDIALRKEDIISFDNKTKAITLLRSKMVLDVGVECSTEAYDFIALLAHLSNFRLRVMLTNNESFSVQFFE